MGLLDNLKNVLGGKKSDAGDDVTKAPSLILKEKGIDPSGLKFAFSSDGSVTLNGTISQESDRQKILDALEGTPGIKEINDNMTVAETPAPAAPEAEPEVADSVTPTTAPTEGTEGAEAEEPTVTSEGDSGDSTTYTVVSGDTLWKIASKFYGEGSQYMRIFEANKDKLENPDRIFPGQELVIPPKDD